MSACGMGATPQTCPEVGACVAERPRPDTCAVMVAGGVGQRFHDPRGKQYIDLCGMPLACWSLLALDRCPSVGHVVVVCAEDRMNEMREDVVGRLSLTCPVTITLSGPERQDSVRNGLLAVPAEFDLVAIHDAARPLVRVEWIERCIARVREDAQVTGALCAAPVTDTLKLAEDGQVIATPDRSYYWAAQTPQVFRRKAIVAAHKAAVWDEYRGTDDASLIERRGGRVVCVDTPGENLKVTRPEDYLVAQALLEGRLMAEGCGIDPLDRGREGRGDGLG